MQWNHACSFDWLKTRQHYLTATDVKDLLPVTRTGRPRTVSDEDRLKVWARKVVQIDVADVISTGAAARGHILESYAIDSYNKNTVGIISCGHLVHVDDLVVPKGSVDYGLAFSPDAWNTNIKHVQLMTFNNHLVVGFDSGCAPTEIGEVKSYNAERHLATAAMPKSLVEERWQLAVAMACLSTIERANLILFNPALGKNQLIVIQYTRKELEKEIETVLEVEKDWLEFINDPDALNNLVNNTPTGMFRFDGDSDYESKINEAVNKANKMNP